MSKSCGNSIYSQLYSYLGTITLKDPPESGFSCKENIFMICSTRKIRRTIMLTMLQKLPLTVSAKRISAPVI